MFNFFSTYRAIERHHLLHGIKNKKPKFIMPKVSVISYEIHSYL